MDLGGRRGSALGNARTKLAIRAKGISVIALLFEMNAETCVHSWKDTTLCSVVLLNLSNKFDYLSTERYIHCSESYT